MTACYGSLHGPFCGDRLMCGIAGFWASQPPTQGVATERLLSMGQAIAHRGPDGFGTWYSGGHGVGFAHRRLAIIDLSASGHQPMVSASARYTISFNGEIFNYRDLRSQLTKAGAAPQWRGNSDTEVMLAAVEAWGLQSALDRFIGMFAFSLWDAQTATLSLVRDRLGVKPLYYAQTSEGLCFGSELKALRKFPAFSTSLDRSALSAYMGSYCVPAPHTIYTQARKLQPGSIAVFRGAKAPPILSRFWSAARVASAGVDAPFEGSEREAIDALELALRDAVKLRMVADVPLGAFLSGGVDSSMVVAAMQAVSSRPVHTFSVESEDPAFDESSASRAVAAHLGTHHTPLRVTAATCREVIPMLPAMFDEPFADSSQIPTFLVSQLARRTVTVALSGDGGDELFGGYNRHVWGGRLWSVHQRFPRLLRSVVAHAMSAIAPSQIDRIFEIGARALPALRVPGYKVHKLASVLALESPDDIHATLANHWSQDDHLVIGDPIGAVPGGENTDLKNVALRMMYLDLVNYLPNDILTKVDRASMAVGLEARVPLLDHRVVEFAWKLPLRLKVRGNTSKWILRQVLSRYVPGKLTSGPKMGFGVPMASWLRGPLKQWAEALLSSERLEREGYLSARVVRQRWREFQDGRKPWEHHLWDVLMFQAWLEHNRAT